jgi:hypothetical protein
VNETLDLQPSRAKEFVMNRYMLMACALAAGVGLMLAYHAGEDAWADCTGCTEEPMVAWDTSPTSTDATQDYFDVDLQFEWAYPDVPNIGAIEFDGDNSVNILTDNQQYPLTIYPAYFFPECCNGSVEVQVTGYLESNPGNGTLSLLGWCWDPFRENTKDVTVIDG